MGVQSKAKFKVSGIGVSWALLTLMGCDSPVSVAVLPDTANPMNPDTPTTPTSTESAIRLIRPGLAVRGMSCLSCHANIQASVITDFGNGDSWFLDENATSNGHAVTPSALFGQYHYDPLPWQTLQPVNGQVFVPKATVPAEIVQNTIAGGSGSMDLATYLTASSIENQSPEWYAYFGMGTAPSTISYTAAVTPPAASGVTLPPVVEEGFMYIGAPTVAEIIGIAPTPTAPAPWIQAMSGSASGLSIVTGVSNKPYITNSGTLLCQGQDVVINGTLLLKNAEIDSGASGCRLYVTGPVFIEGPIQYIDSSQTPPAADPTGSLQITSATAVLMGVGLTGDVYEGGSAQGTLDNHASNQPLSWRLIDDSRNQVFRSAPTAAAYTTWAQSVMSEGENIGSDLLVDASTLSGTLPAGVTTALSAAGQPRMSIQYQRLLLNAPVIHSRYLGQFSGVIVSEIAIFSLGEFNFTFDDIFDNSQLPILPGLPVDILCAGDSAAACNPASSPTPTPPPTPTPSSTPSPNPSPSPTPSPSPSPSSNPGAGNSCTTVFCDS